MNKCTTRKKLILFFLSIPFLLTHANSLDFAPQMREDYRLKIIDFGMYAQSGIFLNNHGNRGREGNGPYMGNVSTTEFSLNQAYLWLGRQADTQTNAFDWGIRFDVSYGTDHYSLSALGADYIRTDGSVKKYWDSKGEDNYLGDYGLAAPQLYAELALYKWKLKAGHFHSHLGYESIFATEADFYNRAFYTDGIPGTLTGVVLARDFGAFNFYGGVANGRNTSFENPFGDYFFLFGAGYAFDEEKYLEYHFIGGREKTKAGKIRLFGNTEDAFVYFHNAYFEWTPYNLRTVTEAHYSYSLPEENGARQTYKSYGLSQYVIYSLDEKISAGLRLEYLHNDYPQYNAGDFEDVFSVTANLTWAPLKWVQVRPEVRYSVADMKIFNLSNRNNYASAKDKAQFIGGVEIVLSFWPNMQN